MKAVIQAGGKGTRLRPYTQIMPKPLLPVGDCSIIEILLKWLRRWGIKETYITIGYLGKLIQYLCNDTREWGMQVHWNKEPEPLGTIGGLKLLKESLSETFISLNGDIITDLNLRDFICFHKDNNAYLTICATTKQINMDFGVLEFEGSLLKTFREKPCMNLSICMGVYCIEPEIIEMIPSGVPFGFDDLVYEVRENKVPVHIYHHNGLWLDVGREEDFRYAQECFVRDHKCKVLGS
jgi:mannose-1-phosphate guanylyltransferase